MRSTRDGKSEWLTNVFQGGDCVRTACPYSRLVVNTKRIYYGMSANTDNLQTIEKELASNESAMKRTEATSFDIGQVN